MIRSLLKRTKFHRAAILLLAMLLTTTTAWGDVALKTKAKVEYIGEGGKVKTATDVPILTDDYADATLGSEGENTWYYVEDELDFSGDVIYLEGTVNIILGDNANLKAESFNGNGATLNIYGTGKLTLYTDDYQCIDCNNLNIYGGTINVYNISTVCPAITVRNVIIYGGKVTVTGGGILADVINLGWTLPDDFIEVRKYNGEVTILPGKELYYNDNNGTVNLSSEDNIFNDDIAGKKLQPVIDPNNPPQPIVITKYVSSYEEFISAFASKKAKIVLDKDINYPLNTVISIKNDACLDLNGHSLKFLVPLAIAIAKDCNVEITDHSESKSGKIIYESAAWGKGVINFGTLSVSNICFNIKNGTTSIINNGTLSVSNVTFTGIYNQANGIIANHNSTVIIGSGVSFSGLNKGIYTHYDYHDDDSDPWKARALTRGNDSESESESEIIEEPAKLYFNALPVFESCGYDLYLDKSIMDFSNATAPLALASGQNKITLKNHVSAFTGAYTKDYKRAFSDPATGTTTCPNDIFNYKEVGDDVEPKYLCGELYFIKTKGYCGVADANEGKNVEWTVADNGNDMLKLTISKNETDGQENYAMADYTTESPAPWANFAATINEVVVGDGVTLSSTFPFDNLSNLNAVTVPVATLEDYLANWSDKADVIKSTGSCGSSQNWSLTKNSGDKLGDNFPLKLTIDGSSYMADYSETSQDIALSTAPWAAQCSNITEISLGKNINTIGTYAFAYCNRVNEVTIPENLLYIRDNAFKGMTELKKVYIKNVKTDKALITRIDGCPFADCSSDLMINLTNANVIAAYINDYYWQKEYGSKFYAEGYCGVADANGGKNIKWSLMPINGETINIGNEDHPDNRQAYALSITKNTDDEDANLAMKESPGYGNWLEDFSHPNGLHHRIKTATIEEGIKNIGASAFASCKNLESATIPSTVTAIGEHGFSGCNKLLGINIPDGVTCIGERTFYDCNSLTSIDIPYTVTSIGEAAFYDCRSLTNIVIPSKVETIDKSAFSGCTALKTVRVMATTPPKIANYGNNGQYAPFSYCESLKYFFVPDVVAYSEAYGWKQDYILPLLRADKTTLFTQDASNHYMTWCDEFEWKKPEGCTVYTVSGVNSEQVQVAEVEGDLIPAYTPVLIKRTEGKLTTDIKAEFSNVVESVSTSGTSYMNINKDTRAYQGTVIASYDGGCVYGNTGAVLNPKNYGWVVNDEYTSTYALYSDKFLMIDADEGIPTHRFIMRVSHGDVGKARSLTIGVGGDTTGMEELKNEKIEELNSEWYDLQGRKLGSKPTRKGLYINNGKKIVIK